MIVFQITEFLDAQSQYARVKKNSGKKLYSKDIEAFVIHKWLLGAQKFEVFFFVFNLLFFIMPFIFDSFIITEYEFVNFDDKDKTATNKDKDEVVASMGIKGLGIFGLIFIILIEFIKAGSSDRNKYDGVLKSKLFQNDQMKKTINFSGFNIILFVLYFGWAFQTMFNSQEIAKMKQSDEKDELKALALNISTQVMQLVHIILLFMTLSMVLEMI